MSGSKKSASPAVPASKDLSATVRIAFPSERAASAVCRALDVDEELQPQRVTRTLSTEGPVLVVQFAATDLKILRVAMASFYDMAILTARTLLEFDPVA